MIDPKHDCWWSGKNRTEVSLSGTRVQGAGVSLRVLLHGLTLRSRIWYSLVYGDHDENILLLAVDSEVALALRNTSCDGNSPMQRALDDRGDFVEYELNGEIRSALGFTLDENGFRMERAEPILQQVSIHDDCFFTIEPVNEAEVRGLVHVIL